MGREVAERLLSTGWRVGTFSRNDNDFLRDARRKYEERFLWEPVELSNADALKNFVKDVSMRFGSVDVLVNNAASLYQGLLLTTPLGQVNSMIAANPLAPVVLSQACARVMTNVGKGGSIINISSINSVRGYRGTAVYAATKAGLDEFTRSLARELGSLNISVNSVLPGYFETTLTAQVKDENRKRIEHLTPLGRLASEKDIANVVTFLLSPQAELITGQSFIIDGGITC
ncbi:3-oxoacyl-[acyl-carrier protein] reductase [Candidatus Burkholderia humilis]|nr:3-oxoacyl-[acyl-carrier protein] reductase [Candidatus Burkholderia humilis]